jgi:hypothetical protein
MSRIKEKLSKIFAAQIPEFIRVGESAITNIRTASTIAGSTTVSVVDTSDLLAGDKLINPAITNTIFVTKILSSNTIEVSNSPTVTLTNQTVKFVREDTTTNFVKFLEAYYKFLEQDQNPQELLQNSRLYADSDSTTDNLIEQFFRTYGNDIPRTIITDKRTFIKHFKDIYKTKGTEEAYKLFFRIMFDSDASFFYPNSITLKPSDGVWRKDYIMKIVAGDGYSPFDFINTKIKGQTSGATAIVENVLKLPITAVTNYNSATSVFELYLSDIRGEFQKEEIVATKLNSAPVIDSAYLSLPTGWGLYTAQQKITWLNQNNISADILLQTGSSISDIDWMKNNGYTGNAAGSLQLNTNIVRANTQVILTKVNINDGKAGYDLNGQLGVFGSIVKIDSVDSIGSIRKIRIIDTGLYFANVGATLGSYVLPPTGTLSGNITIRGNVGTFTSTISHGLNKNNTANIIFYGNTSSYLNGAENVISVSTILDPKRFRFKIVKPLNTITFGNVTTGNVNAVINANVLANILLFSNVNATVFSNILYNANVSNILTYANVSILYSNVYANILIQNGVSSNTMANIIQLIYSNVVASTITTNITVTLNSQAVADTAMSANIKYTEPAIITAVAGIVKESEGYWLNNQGKLSELIYIQGPAVNSINKNKIYYQPFSYVVRSDVTTDNWKDPASKLIHPAGTEVFGEIFIRNEVSANLEVNTPDETWNYLGLTTDSNTAPFGASMTTYSNRLVTNLSVTTDLVYVVFNYL